MSMMTEYLLRQRKEVDFDQIAAEASQARIVMLGEATHGTSEFYEIRAEITKRLIADHGFQFVAVEGDWPSCERINRLVKSTNAESLVSSTLSKAFHRWPQWMWANQETAAFVEWLRDWNLKRHSGASTKQKAGFYGLDVYSLWESLDEIVNYLVRRGASEDELNRAKRAVQCFQPYRRNHELYAVSSSLLHESCEGEVVELLASLRKQGRQYEEEAELGAELNALVAANAERYYRAMLKGEAESWNIRDKHMMEVLLRLLDYYGPSSKAVIWEHNTHIGDARATDMVEENMLNIGQLVRESGLSSFAIGFGTYRGTVMAGKEWGSDAATMIVPEAKPGSWDRIFHEAWGGKDGWIRLQPGDLLAEQGKRHGQRAIGVVYHPKQEWGNYVPTNVSERYDAFIYVNTTKALVPIKLSELVLT